MPTGYPRHRKTLLHSPRLSTKPHTNTGCRPRTGEKWAHEETEEEDSGHADPRDAPRGGEERLLCVRVAPGAECQHGGHCQTCHDGLDADLDRGGHDIGYVGRLGGQLREEDGHRKPGE